MNLRTVYRSIMSFRALFSSPRSFLKTVISFWNGYRVQKKNTYFTTHITTIYPCLGDNTAHTDLDPIYFFQNTWCARKVFETHPKHHYDIGSSAQCVGIISQYVPVTMIDIRPLSLELSGLSFIAGTVLALPFQDASLSSISSICVIEHIGLGRYGDPFDAFGSEKAVRELTRVLASGGNLFISVPVDAHNTVYYNAHRAFTREYVLELFSDCILREEQYIYGTHIFHI